MTLQKSAEKILNNVMKLKKKESLLIITDREKKKIAEAFFMEGLKLTKKIKFILITKTEIDGQEPSGEVAEEMKKYDVLLLITTKSLSHTKARRNATNKGARIASMPNVTEEMLIRFSKANLKKMYALGEKLRKIFNKTKKIRVVAGKGTDFSFDIKPDEKKGNKKLIKNKKVILYIVEKYDRKKAFGNIPFGEVCCRPLEDTGSGKFIIDLSVLDEKVDKPIEVIVKNNSAVSIKGGKTAEKLKKVLDKNGKKAYYIAELGIGLNNSAKITGNILEDEKVLGTCHIAFGNNMSYEGKNNVPVHIDAIIGKPTIYFDDKKIMEKGKFLIK